MIVSLAVAGTALRSGLRIRSARRRGLPPPRGGRERHLRLAKAAVAMVSIGFAGGPISAVWLRGFAPFASLHAWLATSAALLMVATAVLGRRLEHGAQQHRELHARFALGAVVLAAAALGTGFVLLP